MKLRKSLLASFCAIAASTFVAGTAAAGRAAAAIASEAVDDDCVIAGCATRAAADDPNPSCASIADLALTRVVGGNLVKVLAWYDNEMGYTHTLVEHVIKTGATIK